MRKSREAVSVRVDAAVHKYLKLFANSHSQSITKALASVVRDRELAEPMTFKIVRVIVPDAEQYDVKVNGDGDGVCFRPTMEAAIEALADLRKKNGYDTRRFKLQPEIEVLDLRECMPVEKVGPAMSQLNLNFKYNPTTRTYSVSDADKIGNPPLITEGTLQNAYDEAKDECERRGVEVFECITNGFDPSEWDEINK